MAELNRVVAHFNDGKLVKGTTQDFYPNRLLFHIAPAEGGAAMEVRCNLLKAVFFVRTFEGVPGRASIQGFLSAPPATSHGKKIAVRFKDGELLCGYTLSFQPGRDGFVLFPVDPESNNLRIYVVAGSAAEIKAGPAAEALAQKALAKEKET